MSEGFSLDRKNALVTGGTRGIGMAIALGFLKSGANVTICSRKQENVDAAIEELSEHADCVQGLAAHAGRPEELERLVADAENRFGGLDILVNNAGTNPYHGPIVDADVAAWDKTMEVNLRGPFLLSKLVAHSMLQRESGSIINMASVAGKRAWAMHGIYSITKAGLIMLTKVMAQELGSAGVRVNCICPGVIKTRLSEALWTDPEAEAKAAAGKALGRLGTPAEIVGAAIYFASDASSFTTGAVLSVDGGMP